MVSTWMERQFAALLEEKAKARGLSVSRYVRQVADRRRREREGGVVLASLTELEHRTRKIDDNLHEFMRNAEVVDADD